jgi:diguanylate cyclase (GGDEF)-like protein/PAS domain S-box-containing protein
VSPARSAWVLAACAAALATAAWLLPFEALELVGAPLVALGAFFGGRRGGIFIAVWGSAIGVTLYITLGTIDIDDLIALVVGYVILGVAVGVAVDRLREQRARLEETLASMHAFQGQLSASQKRYRLLFERSNDAVYLHGLDAQGEPTRFVAVNDAACHLLGYTREQLLGLRPRTIDAAARPGQLREVMMRLLKEDRVLFETRLKTRDGDLVPVEVSSSLTDVDGELVVISIARDIRRRKEEEQRLVELSLRDQLTGLLNRRGFLVMLPEHRKRAKRSKAPVIVLYADLDGLKEINDRFGHARGDDVLREVATVMRETFRESDLVARLGGDEFCVVAETDSPADSSAFAARLDEALAVAAQHLDLHLSMSRGSVLTDWHGLEDPEALLERADALMYAHKRGRRGETERPQGDAGGNGG